MRTIPTTLATFAVLATLGSIHAPELHGLQEREQQHIHGEHVGDSIVGQVAQVNDEELTVRTEEGETVSFQIDADTKVKNALRPTPETETRDEVADLNPGDQVVIHYRIGDAPDERIAVAIEVRSDEASASLWQTIGNEPTDRIDGETRTESAQPEFDRPQDANGDPVEGRVAQANSEEVTVRTEDGEAKTFQIDADTRVVDATGQVIESEEDRLAALSIGTEVVVRARTDETTAEPVAAVIEVQIR
jgi:outer membrane lipoprotein SlyB